MAVQKTGLAEQVPLIKAIQKDNLVQGVKLLREWLDQHGYNESANDCVHRLIVRETGKCHHCGVTP